MFPLRDDNPTEIFPLFTIALIVANIAAWLLVQGGGDPAMLEASVCTYGVIPAELTNATAREAGQALACPQGGLTYQAAFSSMFMHGGWLHLASNMWFLWLFGNNIEDSMGRLRFLAFYLICGLAAVALQVASSPGSTLPMVGASGAISGVMGAYLMLYPRVRIQTLFIIIIFIKIFPIPAWVVLAQWFALQLFSGLAAPETASGGVAIWAHVGGFVAGAVLAKVFANRTLVEAKRHHVRLSPRQIPNHGWW